MSRRRDLQSVRQSRYEVVGAEVGGRGGEQSQDDPLLERRAGVGQQVVEQGSHKELLSKNGTYARLWAHQSGGFIANELDADEERDLARAAGGRP